MCTVTYTPSTPINMQDLLEKISTLPYVLSMGPDTTEKHVVRMRYGFITLSLCTDGNLQLKATSFNPAVPLSDVNLRHLIDFVHNTIHPHVIPPHIKTYLFDIMAYHEDYTTRYVYTSTRRLRDMGYNHIMAMLTNELPEDFIKENQLHHRPYEFMPNNKWDTLTYFNNPHTTDMILQVLDTTRNNG